MQKLDYLKYSLLTTCGAIIFSGQAVAQDQSGTAQDEARSSGMMGDIVVTARRTEESLQDVPQSIAAYSQETLDQQGVRRIDDIAAKTPGVTLTRGDGRNGSAANISIRGISSTAGSATTGIYIDDTPIQVRSIGFSAFNPFPAVFDLERVEVLRGPQGTLFGAGSEGGTVRFITPRPDLNDIRAYGRAELATTEGGAESYELGAALSVPLITDKLALRASGYFRRDGGFIDRVDFDRTTREPTTLIDKDANSQDSLVFQASMALAPTDGLTITPSVYYQKVTNDESNTYWEVLSDPDDNQYRTGTALPNTNRDRFVLPALKVELELGAVTLVSNTSYFDRNQTAVNDYTAFEAGIWASNPFYPPGIEARALQFNEQKNFTQEIRLQSADPEARLSWVVGAFYTHNKQRAAQFVENEYLDDPVLLGFPATPDPNGPTLFDIIFGGVPLVDGRFTFVLDDMDALDEQIAGFGQLDFKLTEKLTLTAGVRVAEAKFKADANFYGPVVGPEVNDAGAQKESPITPKFGVSYEIDEDNMVYASAAKGYRVGGYNPAVGVPCAPFLANFGLTERPAFFGSDSVWSFEVGTKNRLLDRRLQVDASAFYIDWKNIQQTVALQCGFQFVENLGSATSKGFDVALQAAVTDDLTLGAAIGYTKAEFNDTVYAGPARGPTIFPLVIEGDDIALNPWTIYLNGQYNYDIVGHRGYVRVDFQHLSRQDALTSANNPDRGPAVDLTLPGRPGSSNLSLRTGIDFDTFDVSLFVNNVLNANPELVRGRVPGPLGPNALYTNVTQRPRTFGITLTGRY